MPWAEVLEKLVRKLALQAALQRLPAMQTRFIVIPALAVIPTEIHTFLYYLDMSGKVKMSLINTILIVADGNSRLAAKLRGNQSFPSLLTMQNIALV